MAMPQFQDYFKPLTPAIKGALNSLMGCGAVFGCLAAGIFSDRWGRRDSIYGFALIFIVGGVLQCASHNIAMQEVPMYNAELAPKEICGRLTGFQQLMIDAGMLISAWLDYGTMYVQSDWSWRIPYLVQTIPAILLAACPFILPRSPRWLIEKGRTEDTLDVLAKVHGNANRNHLCVLQEFNEINDNIQLENNVAVDSYVRMVKDPRNRHVLSVGCSVAIFQQLTGANVIMYCAAFMFQQAGLKASLSVGMYLVDKVGRVKLMVIGSIGMCCGFFIMAGLYGGLGYTEWNEEQSSHVINMTPVAWIYIAEIFPLRIRSKGFALASAILWVGNILVGQIASILMDSITYATYIVYGIIGLIMLAWMFLFALEPRGLSLEEMELVFHGSVIVTNFKYDEYL
ncbi:hypothetical protein BDF20DRAFT_995096 [Mycotypha africana]|uniref:uncharacterized protein n=1 Tax=Mycotypha africana TaxID=64632 RepID=UPI0023001F72|nr:uncharacterized protein BDF20DRAFT_995096 [Mycotypha africana]KAI8975494.1 hypothetical protein BDF20DRAFT_995096 [Mycotypha africana]